MFVEYMIFVFKKTVFNLIGLIVILGIVASCLVLQKRVNSKVQFGQVSIRGHVFNIEVAATKSEKEKGLGERELICTDCGMLFVFDETGNYSFWMKDMRFALDILWIRNGRVVFIKKNVSPVFSGTLNPMGDADRVLELNAGKVDEFGIAVGDEASGIDFRF